VQHPDPRAAELDHELLGQEVTERRLVHVAAHPVHGRPERAQLLERAGRREVAAVEDRVGGPQALETRLGEPSGSPREVRVRDRRDDRHGGEG
jgi:hypothetical protein